MTFGQRFLLMLFIVLAIMFALALLGYYSGGWEDDPAPIAQRFGLASAETRPEFCLEDEETRERIRTIMMEALDEALHDDFKSKLLIWLRDERGQPDRARVGVRQAIHAHQVARKLALEWMPPVCGG